MKRLILRKKLTASDKDKQTLRLLRQQVCLNEQMKTLGYVTDSEYQRIGLSLIKTLETLEAKYVQV